MSQFNDKDVLFQKLGNTWYVYCESGDDVIYTALPQGIDPTEMKFELYEIIEEHMDQLASQSKPRKRLENSI